MRKYQLIEKNTPKPLYDLLCNEEIILEAVLYNEALQFIYKSMQPGDTYQEIHGPKHIFSIINYDRLMELKKEHEKFDRGEWD